jgi:hypothetical protein
MSVRAAAGEEDNVARFPVPGDRQRNRDVAAFSSSAAVERESGILYLFRGVA